MVRTRHSLPNPSSNNPEALSERAQAEIRKLAIDGKGALVGEKVEPQELETYHWRGAVYAKAAGTKREWIEDGGYGGRRDKDKRRKVGHHGDGDGQLGGEVKMEEDGEREDARAGALVTPPASEESTGASTTRGNGERKRVWSSGWTNARSSPNREHAASASKKPLDTPTDALSRQEEDEANTPAAVDKRRDPDATTARKGIDTNISRITGIDVNNSIDSIDLDNDHEDDDTMGPPTGKFWDDIRNNARLGGPGRTTRQATNAARDQQQGGAQQDDGDRLETPVRPPSTRSNASSTRARPSLGGRSTASSTRGRSSPLRRPTASSARGRRSVRRPSASSTRRPSTRRPTTSTDHVPIVSDDDNEAPVNNDEQAPLVDPAPTSTTNAARTWAPATAANQARVSAAVPQTDDSPTIDIPQRDSMDPTRRLVANLRELARINTLRDLVRQERMAITLGGRESWHAFRRSLAGMRARAHQARVQPFRRPPPAHPPLALQKAVDILGPDDSSGETPPPRPAGSANPSLNPQPRTSTPRPNPATNPDRAESALPRHRNHDTAQETPAQRNTRRNAEIAAVRGWDAVLEPSMQLEERTIAQQTEGAPVSDDETEGERAARLRGRRPRGGDPTVPPVQQTSTVPAQQGRTPSQRGAFPTAQQILDRTPVQAEQPPAYSPQPPAPQAPSAAQPQAPTSPSYPELSAAQQRRQDGFDRNRGMWSPTPEFDERGRKVLLPGEEEEG